VYKLDFDTGFSKRFLSLREIVRKPRDYFEKNFGFPANTLRGWENPSSMQRSFKRQTLDRYIEIYAKNLGVIVTTDWLLYGVGTSPIMKEKIFISSDATVDLLLSELPFFFLIDRNLLIRRVNPFYSDFISNKPITEIEGKHFEEVVGTKTFDQHLPIFKEALEGKISRYPFNVSRKNSESKKLLIHCTPAINDYKEIIGFFNFIEKGV
jgi:hypothetical protein